MDPALLFKRLEAQYGLPSYLDGAWNIESSRGRNLTNKASGARGHFQFMPRTAAAYGVTDPNDLETSAAGAARMAAESVKRLAKIGAPVTAGNIYLMHQQGPGGAAALLRNPAASAISVLAQVYGSQEHARRAIELNGGKTTWTAGEFANHVASQYYSKAGIDPPADKATPTSAKPQPKDEGFLPSIQNLPRLAAAKFQEMLDGLGQTQTPANQSTAPTANTPDQPTPGFGSALMSLLK